MTTQASTPSSPPAAGSWQQSPFWRFMAVLFVAALFYIGNGLANAQYTAGFQTEHGFNRGPGAWSSFNPFENAVFADSGQLAHIQGNANMVVTTINKGESLLVWIFGPEVSGVPEMKRVVRYDYR
jgi:hypothetical protein